MRPAEFSLEGRPIRKVRQSVSRLTKAGYRLRVVAGGRRRREAPRRARRGLARVARQPAGARLHDGDRRPVRAGNGVRRRGGREGRGRRLPPSRADAGRRRLVAEHDAPPPGRPERADGVPHRRDARVGEGRGRRRGLAQLLRVHGVHLPGARRHAARAVSSAARSSPPTVSSSSSACTSSTGSSSRNGARATSASSGSPTCRSSASRTSTSSSCSCRLRGPGGLRLKCCALQPGIEVVLRRAPTGKARGLLLWRGRRVVLRGRGALRASRPALVRLRVSPAAPGLTLRPWCRLWARALRPRLHPGPEPTRSVGAGRSSARGWRRHHRARRTRPTPTSGRARRLRRRALYGVQPSMREERSSSRMSH